MTFVIVGDSSTGVELVGAVVDATHYTHPHDFKWIDTTNTRIILIDGGRRLAKAMPAATSTQYGYP